MADSPEVDRSPPPAQDQAPGTCLPNRARECSFRREATQKREYFNTAIQGYAEHQPDAFAFIQSPLWEAAPGERFWANVPGTAMQGWWDSNHMLLKASYYLVPYLCSAFQRVGAVSSHRYLVPYLCSTHAPHLSEWGCFSQRNMRRE